MKLRTATGDINPLPQLRVRIGPLRQKSSKAQINVADRIAWFRGKVINVNIQVEMVQIGTALINVPFDLDIFAPLTGDKTRATLTNQ